MQFKLGCGCAHRIVSGLIRILFRLFALALQQHIVTVHPLQAASRRIYPRHFLRLGNGCGLLYPGRGFPALFPEILRFLHPFYGNGTEHGMSGTAADPAVELCLLRLHGFQFFTDFLKLPASLFRFCFFHAAPVHRFFLTDPALFGIIVHQCLVSGQIQQSQIMGTGLLKCIRKTGLIQKIHGHVLSDFLQVFTMTLHELHERAHMRLFAFPVLRVFPHVSKANCFQSVPAQVKQA